MTIVIPTHGRSSLLPRTLASLAECEWPSCVHEVIVVENGGQYGAEQNVRQAVASLPVRYVYHPEGNKSAALNRVLNELAATWLILFDDDVRFDRGALAAYAAAIEERRGGVYFGGPVYVDYETAPEEWVWLPPSARGWKLDSRTACPAATLFLGANWAVYSEDLRGTGGFDPNYGPGSPTGMRGQESNMQRRLQACGVVPRYVPEALVWHYVPADRCSPEWSLRRAYQHALEAALKAPPEQVTMLFGVPRWRIRQLLADYGRVVRESWTGDRRSRYQAKLVFRRNAGYLKGLRLAARRQHRSSGGDAPGASST